MAYALNRLLNGFLLTTGVVAGLVATLTLMTWSLCTGNTKSKAYVTVMRSDLRNLADPSRTAGPFHPSVGVHLMAVDGTVRATHDRLPGAWCVLEAGEPVHVTCETPYRLSSVDKHMTQKNVLNVSVEYSLIALTLRRRRRQAARQST